MKSSPSSLNELYALSDNESSSGARERGPSVVMIYVWAPLAGLTASNVAVSCTSTPDTW